MWEVQEIMGKVKYGVKEEGMKLRFCENYVRSSWAEGNKTLAKCKHRKWEITVKGSKCHFVSKLESKNIRNNLSVCT